METIDTDLNRQVDLVESGSKPTVRTRRKPGCCLRGAARLHIVRAIKRVVDDMKIDFVTILNVNLPGGTRADND